MKIKKKIENTELRELADFMGKEVEITIEQISEDSRILIRPDGTILKPNKETRESLDQTERELTSGKLLGASFSNVDDLMKHLTEED